MPTRIKQIEDGNRTILRVAGSLMAEDAELLERLCAKLRETDSVRPIVLDLAEVTFFDSDSASILLRLQNEMGAEFENMHLVVQSAIDLADRTSRE